MGFAYPSRAAICQTCLERQLGEVCRAAIELVHVVSGKAWEDCSTVFRQLDRIGKLGSTSRRIF